MTEEVKATEAEAKPEAPAKATRAKKIEVPVNYLRYKTAEKHTVGFDILLRGETINGSWGRKQGTVEFMVPEGLADAMEAHWHFTSGNVVRADDDEKAE